MGILKASLYPVFHFFSSLILARISLLHKDLSVNIALAKAALKKRAESEEKRFFMNLAVYLIRFTML